MISDGQLEQNLQQGEIAARERGLRGTCRALIGCGIATAALFWGFVIVAFLLPADETAATSGRSDRQLNEVRAPSGHT